MLKIQVDLKTPQINSFVYFSTNRDISRRNRLDTTLGFVIVKRILQRHWSLHQMPSIHSGKVQRYRERNL